MVIRGNIRGNPQQLSHYLLAMKENEAIRILDVNGQPSPLPDDLHQAVFLMGVSAELSRTDKGLFHAQINPAIGEDVDMQDQDWLRAADILGQQLGFEQQSRAIVLHTKKGRTHAHVVWERFDHTQQKMVDNSFSRLAQDRARKEMELVFGHNRTPHRNKHRPELKAALTQLWNETETGTEFIKAAQENGYVISKGFGRSPFMVVDENGRSFDLTRQLKGIRLKEVRQRLRNETLLDEKAAIVFARKNRRDENQQERGGDGTGKQNTALKLKIASMKEDFASNSNDMAANDNNKPSLSIKYHFKENSQKITEPDNSEKNKPHEPKENEKTEEQSRAEKRQQLRQQYRESKQEATEKETVTKQFANNKEEMMPPEQKQPVKEMFAENKEDVTKSEREKEREKQREEYRKRSQSNDEIQRSRNREKGYER